MATALVDHRLPLRIASPEDFARVRQFLGEAGYNEATLCQALKISGMGDFGHIRWDEIQLENLPEPLGWCINIFARGSAVPTAESRRICGEVVFAAIEALGLLRPARKTPDAVVCPVWMYPVDGFIIASDLCHGPEGDPYTQETDVVFPAIYTGTLRFLQLLPEGRGGDTLDLCGGSGIGALHLSRTARTAATADLTRRAAHFAEFNARLNEVSMTGYCGDLYEPVHSREFDLISAHPPFVPASGDNMVYRDGGDTGEEIIKRIVEGLPVRLKPEGTCLILCVARDTKELPFEKRAQAWLGAAASEFDVVFGLEHVMTVDEVVRSICKRNQEVEGERSKQLLRRLQSLDTRRFVYGALFICRNGDASGQAPCRVHLTATGRAQDFERLIAWRSFCGKAGSNDWLSNSRPRLAPGLQLTVRHAVHEGHLAPMEFMFSIERGLQAALRLDGWVVPLLARLEGKLSVAEMIQGARQTDELPQTFDDAAFLNLVRMMIERGFFEVDIPQAPG